ncbi:MAG TPA: leucyl aminopeptidase [Longimicrobiales bacterium]
MAELRVSTVHAAAPDVATPLLVLPIYERDDKLSGAAADVDQRMNGAVARVLKSGDFRGRKDETLMLFPAPDSLKAERVLLLGIGKRDGYTLEKLRRAVGLALRTAEKMGLKAFALSLEHTSHSSERLGLALAARAASEAAVMGAWDFREYKSKRNDDDPRKTVEEMVLITANDREHKDVEAAAGLGVVLGRSANLARGLASHPGNVATPTYLANVAQEIAGQHNMKITVLDREQMRAEKMFALLAVAQGSAEEPRFIALEYSGGKQGDRPLVLVGKGVTFDSGGISIKPAERMEDMKYDMSGAAAVLGAMRGIAELKLKANVVGIIPATENLPSGTAVKPGDVISSHLGKSIEIINTDAEGRLILADALAYARRYKPAAMIDAATLTGAVVVALGQQAIGLMGNDGDLIDEVMAAGLRAGERCWNLPLWDEYRELLDSNIADIKNSGGRYAGTITGGWFLKDFVADDIPWAHLDIAGMAYKDEAASYLRKGATGTPTRLFIEWVRSRSEG